MKMKGAAIGTIATVTALGMLGSLGGTEDIADTPVTDIMTDTYAIVETVDIDTETVIETLESVITTQEIVTEPPVIVTEPPKPVTTAPETEPPKPVTTALETEAPKPTASAQKPAETQKPVKVDNITNINVTSPIAPNSIATLTAKVLPNTKYDIDVYYSSGRSKAKGLEEKTSDANGNISWSWKVGQNTKSGEYRIVVYGAGETKEITFIVS